MKKILIDCGHGKNTPGKRSPIWKTGLQLFEWAYNREIGKKVVSQLQEKGILATLIVTEDDDISLAQRVKRVNEICEQVGKQNVLLISIHCNASAKPNTGTGWEAYTSEGETKADEYADIFYKHAMIKLSDFKIRKGNSIEHLNKEARFAILVHTNCPAILTENLFMDNEKDCLFLLSDAGKKAIIDLHVDAITEICNLK